MGIGDPSDPTTDFFDTHRAQCVQYASKLRSVVGAELIVAKFDEAIAACDAAIAAGRKRTDMAAALATLAPLVARFQAMPKALQDNFKAALTADHSTK